MMLLDVIWAATAPLILVAAGAIVFVLLTRTGWSGIARALAAAVVVVAPTATLWVQDYHEFESVCKGVGKPRVLARAITDGIVLDSPTANSFGTRYLYDQGFSWMEIPSIYGRGEIDRLTREPGGNIRTDRVREISARYEVRETFETPYAHTGLSMTTVLERQTGVLMARAGSANFSGGRAKWVLGAYGVRGCPSAMSSSNDFRVYYNLAKYALRPDELKN